MMSINFSTAAGGPEMKGESRLQELQRLRRRDALRRKNGDPPFDLLMILTP
jgi:hypothetical protein